MKKIFVGSCLIVSSLLSNDIKYTETYNYAKQTYKNAKETYSSHAKETYKNAKEFFNNLSSINIEDNLPADKCGSLNSQCFNAGITINEHIKIQTKKAGSEFNLTLKHNIGCGWTWKHHIGVVLVDNTTGNLITEPQEIDADITTDEVTATFNVKNAYKNVSVRFIHLKPLKCELENGFKWLYQCVKKIDNAIQEQPTNIKDILNKPFVLADQFQCFEVNSSNWMNRGEPVSCPANIDEIKDKLPTYNTPPTAKFYYAIPKENKCYQIENPCDTHNPYISQSSDNFAIRPDHFEVTLPSNIHANIPAKITVEVKNASGDIITNYNNSSANLKVIFKDKDGNPVDAQYSFDIRNGKGTGKVIFSNPVEGVTVSIEDEHFADIDKDDTPEDKRIAKTDSPSSSTSNVSNGGSKYWAGVGTNEKENTPTKNTINSDIKQNVKKDLHFQKMGW